MTPVIFSGGGGDNGAVWHYLRRHRHRGCRAQLAQGASGNGAAFDSRICRGRDTSRRKIPTKSKCEKEEVPCRFAASTVPGMDGGQQQQKGRGRSMNYLGIGSWNWQLPKHELPRVGGDCHPARLRQQEDEEEGLLRSERSPNVSDCCDPISIIIILVLVAAVIQFWLRRRKTDAIIGEERRRSATVLRIYFNLTATAERASCPICPRLATGVLQGSKDFLGGKLLQTRLKYCVITGRFGTGYAT